MKLEQLIEVAKRGAVLRHPDTSDVIYDHRDMNFITRHNLDVIVLQVEMLDNNWQIETPHEGACTECKGIGEITGSPDGGKSFNQYDCPRCNGTGEEPIEEKPAVVTVRVIKCSNPIFTYRKKIGRVYENVIDDGTWWSTAAPDYNIKKKDCEIIPPYDHSKYRLMARDELVMKGDIHSFEGGWSLSQNSTQKHPCQCEMYIYLRPLPQQEERDEAHDREICEHIVEVEGRCTSKWPCCSCLFSDFCYSETTDEELEQAAQNWLTAHPIEPAPEEDGCLPGYHKVEVIISSGELYCPMNGVSNDHLYNIISLPDWSGRYGYILDGLNQIWWSNLPRRVDGQVPNYVEMKTTPQEGR